MRTTPIALFDDLDCETSFSIVQLHPPSRLCPHILLRRPWSDFVFAFCCRLDRLLKHDKSSKKSKNFISIFMCASRANVNANKRDNEPSCAPVDMHNGVTITGLAAGCR